jgi:hypothetical protein
MCDTAQHRLGRMGTMTFGTKGAKPNFIETLRETGV